MIFQEDKLLVVAGPCSLENEAVCGAVAATLDTLRTRYPQVTWVFKGSYDKANRTSLGSSRGPGLEDGLGLLQKIRQRYGFAVTTDVHLPEQCGPVAEVCDILQIPAFLCRQTDLLVAAAATGKVVNVKKGQFLSPAEMAFVVEKLKQSGAVEIWQTERGTFFGYQNLVVDMRSFALMGRHCQPTIFDATHSVQLPGAAGGKSGGQRDFVTPLARAALAAGARGLFIETHPDPDKALSDGPSQIPLDDFPALIRQCINIHTCVRGAEADTT